MRVQHSERSLPLSLLWHCALGSAALYDEIVHTQHGDIQGYPAFNSSHTGNLTGWQNISVWKNIPFAASTAGENRWKAPQPAAPWNSTLDAKDFGPICPTAIDHTNYTVSEDCLSLNIWSPATSCDAKLPVVMWSYPAQSSARDDLFNGGGMASKDIVFVNYNYRTGAFGWLAHPELSDEFSAVTGSNSSGNWGMLDQFAALKWIHENIAAFGGDPKRITVMGQSAGSAATYHILNSPLTKGLINGAIIESGVREPHDPLSTSLAEGYATLDARLEEGTDWLTSLNITSIEEARKLPYQTFVTAFHATDAPDFGATLDYYAMPDNYLNTLLKGEAHQVPVLTGNTKDESGATFGLNISLETYLSDLNTTYTGEWVDRFLELYPANDSASAADAYNSQWTDRSKVGTWLWTQLWYHASHEPVYTYLWDHAPPGQDAGAYHESEINYVLNNLYDTDKPWTAQDYEIARTMNQYWVNFIKTGNPNGHGLVDWPVTDQAPKVQRVGNAFEHVPVASAAKVELYKDWFVTLPAY